MSTKVFVGNLAFRTTDQNLVDLFSAVGQVKSASIITRGRRSLGYGFVELSSADQANAAVAKFNGHTLLERQLKVEVAKEPSERPPKPDRPPRQPRQPKDGAASNGNGNGNGEKAGGPAKRRRQRRTPSKDGQAGGSPAGDKAGADKPKRERPPRQERPKVVSDTTLFVANLPFSVDDAQLLAIFNGLKPKTAHVVRTRNDRSRGYGFVEFATKGDQQAALASKNGANVDGPNGPRQITVTVSTSAPPPPNASQ
jgi:RNA recognition motif-containing protein